MVEEEEEAEIVPQAVEVVFRPSESYLCLLIFA
jgi:hypothetical protein